MPTIRQLLETSVSEAISRVTGVSNNKPHVIYATRPEFGDYQANGVMAIAKEQRCNPRELAQKVVEVLDAGELLSRAEVAGPGFINLFLSDAALQLRAAECLADTQKLISPADTPQTIVVDYSSPNLAKEMHVGHLRGTIIGDCIARIMEALGHRLIRQNHVGDWGTQFGMLIAHLESLKEEGHTLSTELADLEIFYRTAKERFDNEDGFADKARSYVVKLQQGDAHCLSMWEQFINESLHHCEAIYDVLNVSLRREDLKAESFYNSELPDIVNELDEKDLLTVSEGARCVFLDEFVGKEGKPLPAIIQKSDGGYLYATTDLAAVRYRSRTLAADRVLYVVDARQSLHFQQVFAIARKAGFVSENCSLEHIAYGTMMGQDGKPFKTRSGDTVKLRELLSESVRRAYDLVSEKNPELPAQDRQQIAEVVGIAAVKYSELSKNRNSDYIFDWSSMLSFEGNTAPYMLYAYARIKSILRKQTSEADLSAAIAVQDPEERALLLKILQFPETVDLVSRDCYPNHLCLYLYELAGSFMRFYESCPILKAEEDLRKSRLALAHLTATTLQQGLRLLGIDTLEKM